MQLYRHVYSSLQWLEQQQQQQIEEEEGEGGGRKRKSSGEYFQIRIMRLVHLVSLTLIAK